MKRWRSAQCIVPFRIKYNVRKIYWKNANDIDAGITDSTPAHETYVNFVNIKSMNQEQSIEGVMLT